MKFNYCCLQVLRLFSILLLTSSSLNAQKQFKALLITETAGWHHESILNGTKALEELALKHNFDLKRHQQAIKVTKKLLGEYDVVIFLNTTGDIFDEEEQRDFEEYIHEGGGYAGIHAASDTEYGWEWYTKLVGRMFHIHPRQQTALLKFIDTNFPGLEHFPEKMLWTDEWYEFGEEKVSGLNYLITVDEATFDAKVVWENRDPAPDGTLVDRIGEGMGIFHPISWYHEFDGGRSFYTALGHIEKVYENHWFLEHLYGGIYYAATGKGVK